MIDDAKIRLNVGGAIFETTTQTIKESEYLYNLVHGTWKESLPDISEIFIDRDGFLFRYILLYLRTDEVDIEKQYLKSLNNEAEFYMLPKLSEKINAIMNVKQKKIVYQLLNQSELASLSGMDVTTGLGLIDSRQTVKPDLELITTINCFMKEYRCPLDIRIHNEGLAYCGISCMKAMDGNKEFLYKEQNLYLVAVLSE